MWSIHTVKSDSTFKRKEILAPSTPCTNPKNVMLSERSQTEKDKYCVILLPREVRVIETESRRWGLGRGC